MHALDLVVGSRLVVRNLIALGLSGLHRDTPRLAKAIALFVIVYAASPIDLTPEVLPIPSYLDDLVMLAVLSWLAVHMLPSNVWRESCVQSDRWLSMAADRLQRVSNELLFAAVLLALAGWLGMWFGLARA
jgi:uncharacterized membrane protein YkvA (DUF1232 family)